MNEIFKKASEAYEILSNPIKRKIYDEEGIYSIETVQEKQGKANENFQMKFENTDLWNQQMFSSFLSGENFFPSFSQ